MYYAQNSEKRNIFYLGEEIFLNEAIFVTP